MYRFMHCSCDSIEKIFSSADCGTASVAIIFDLYKQVNFIHPEDFDRLIDNFLWCQSWNWANVQRIFERKKNWNFDLKGTSKNEITKKLMKDEFYALDANEVKVPFVSQNWWIPSFFIHFAFVFLALGRDHLFYIFDLYWFSIIEPHFKIRFNIQNSIRSGIL